MKNKILTKNQAIFLGKCRENDFIKKNFYLTGGTVLAAFYLRHRYSEDLDFFSEDEVDLLALNVFLKKIKKEIGVSRIDFQQSFNRNMFFLDFKNGTLKTEFTNFPFPRIQKRILKNGLQIDSLLDIAVNKLFSVYQRTQARDYLDLYFICKGKRFLVGDLIKKARLKFDWHIDLLQLGAQFVKAKDVKDFPRMIKKIKNEEWQNFFVREAKKFKDTIM